MVRRREVEKRGGEDASHGLGEERLRRGLGEARWRREVGRREVEKGV